MFGRNIPKTWIGIIICDIPNKSGAAITRSAGRRIPVTKEE